MTRIVTNEDVKKYERLVTKYLRDNVIKNWSGATLKTDDQEMALGNTGMSVADFRQQLLMEVVIALQRYNPEYRTKDGKSVAEMTFVYHHLWNRVGQLMKRATKQKSGYGTYHSEIELIIGEKFEERV